MTPEEKRAMWISLVSAALGGLTVALVLKITRPIQRVVVVEEEDRKDSELTEDERRERRKAILEFYDGE